ncbi:cation:proton antiporter [Mycoplasmatota bacterium WC44]
MMDLLLSSSTEHVGETIYTTLLGLALVIIIGMFAGKLFEKIKIPHITGYLVAGILIGPSVLGLVSHESLEGLDIVTNVALGFIAFGIGSEILFRNLKETGVQVFIITLLQAAFAVAFVLVLLLIFNAPLWLALILGAIATATAPGPIMMLTKKYRAKGPVTSTMLPLVGLDDAIGIVVFGVLLSVGASIYTGHGNGILELLKAPLLEIFLSVVAGAIIGFLVKLALKFEKHHSDEYILVVTVVAILISVAIAEIGLFGQHLSIILTPMIAGMTFANTIKNDELHHSVAIIDSFNPVILIAFFTLAGAHLDLSVLTNLSGGSDIVGNSVALLGGIYIISRAIGKLFGSWFGAVVTKAHPNVRRWLGITLLPQAGVAIGMANAAKATLDGEAGTVVLTIVLAATVIYELFGPIGVKIALEKSGEIGVKEY